MNMTPIDPNALDEVEVVEIADDRIHLAVTPAIAHVMQRIQFLEQQVALLQQAQNRAATRDKDDQDDPE